MLGRRALAPARGAGAPAGGAPRSVRRRRRDGRAVHAGATPLRDAASARRPGLRRTCAPTRAHDTDVAPPEKDAAPTEEEARLARLQSLVPGQDAVAMVARCPELLEVSPRAFATRLMQLQTLLPGLDVLTVVAAEPGLLALPDVADVVAASIAKLESLCPDDYCPADALGIVEENPELLLRLRHYAHDVDFSRLPMEVQNMLVVGGGGPGGWKDWEEDEDW